ncbi:MAG: DUF4190 domain-containing protein [Fimbriimonadaceae bacterium]|nr:MAG: DUF4190 domain-containing protein [Fimbriimonadaceae bacterium]
MNEAQYLIEGGGMPPMTVDFETLSGYFRRGELNSLIVRLAETGQILTMDQIRELIDSQSAAQLPPVVVPGGQWLAPPTPADMREQQTQISGERKDGNQDPMRFVAPIHSSGWAVTASYLGLLSVLFIFAPFAIITGLKALQDLKANPHKTGKGRAIFGIVIGAVCLVLYGSLLLAGIMNRPR